MITHRYGQILPFRWMINGFLVSIGCFLVYNSVIQHFSFLWCHCSTWSDVSAWLHMFRMVACDSHGWSREFFLVFQCSQTRRQCRGSHSTLSTQWRRSLSLSTVSAWWRCVRSETTPSCITASSASTNSYVPRLVSLLLFSVFLQEKRV